MFTIDKHSRTPLYEQLIDQFESCILSGDIAADGKLPSVRSLSLQLNINPNTLQRAFLEIERRGLCYTVPGSGRYLAADALERLQAGSSAQIQMLQKTVLALKTRGVPKEQMINMIERLYESNERNQTNI